MNDRELDTLIAEKVMGYGSKSNCRRTKQRWICQCGDCDPIPHYSTDIGSAFDMESILSRKEDFSSAYGDNLALLAQGEWDEESGNQGHVPMNWACAHASPRLRCLAALRTLGIDTDNLSKEKN